MAPATSKRTSKKKIRRHAALRVILGAAAIAVVLFYGTVGVVLIFLSWMDPPFTAVQVERRLDASAKGLPYRKRYAFVPLNRISPQLQHAVIAAEDTRFLAHHGFDWKEIGRAVNEDLENGRKRGASTITQQLVRNLFLSTGRSVVRKAVEFSIVPMTDGVLSESRILEL